MEQELNLFKLKDYRKILNTVLTAKQERNPRFSMRAFSQYLGLSPSAIRQIISGTKNLSYDAALKVAKKLGLDELHTEYFSTLVHLESTKDPDVQRILKQRLRLMRPYAPTSSVGSENVLLEAWYYSAIMTLVAMLEGPRDPVGIGKVLGLSEKEVTLAMQRLIDDKLLFRHPDGKFTIPARVTSFGEPGQYARIFKQIMDKAFQALETRPNSEQIALAEVVRFSPELMPEMEKLTVDYVRQVCSILHDPDRPAPVDMCALQVSFCSLLAKG
jgi:uncharacterized protein (TIGR02147 family)